MDNQIKGYDYEKFINEFLNTKDDIKISYLWKDIPEQILFDFGFIKSYNDNRLKRKTNNINKLEDIGTDIIYITKDDKCIIVQCKNYSNSIIINDLAGFFFIMCEHIDKIGEIYYTNQISKKISIDRIKCIHKEFIIQENINIIKPYDYQNKIIKLAEEYYKINNSSILNLPCGLGKTLISCYISMSYKIVIMVTPLKQYAKQNIDRFKLYEKDRKSILIDSDGTTCIDQINDFIKNNPKSKILLSVTFRSCKLINDINLNNDIFIIFDEFHNFSWNNIYDKDNDINKLINNKNIKKLYISATPRIYELENKDDDIDINEVFGNYIYKMSFNEAIKNKYISDYELYLPIFSYEINEEINKLNINADYLLKIQFLIEAVKICGTLKMIIYVKTHDEINDFINEFNKLNEYYSYDILINKITCDNNYKSRNKILDEFNYSDKINLLFSVHILDEAIDIPSCNAIYMSYVSNSKIKNIQRMSRAMRYKNNKIAKIFLFCHETDEALDYISSIREYDVDFIKKINYIKISNEIINREERIKNNKEYIEKNKIKILGIKLYRYENWHDKLELVKIFINKNNRKPTLKDNKILFTWICAQQTMYKIKDGIMKNEKIYNEWFNFINSDKYKKYFEENNTHWINNLYKTKDFIDKNQKKPSTVDINIENVVLSNWIRAQQQNYSRKNNIMKDEYIYNLWKDFINDNKYKQYFEDLNIRWVNTLNKVKNFIDDNHKKPTENDDKILSKWISHQIQNVKNKNRSMNDEYIYNLWNNFINDDKYKQYFEDNDVQWKNTLDIVKKYINDNKKRPPGKNKDKEINKLACWITIQMQQYSNKEYIMKNEEIYNLWSNFINDNQYKKYFEDNITVWNNKLKELKLYINNNNKNPSPTDKNLELKTLGAWVKTQNNSFKNKTNIMKNDEIYNTWSNFIQEFSQYFNK
jgi:superfamily II DNA or RNA helicase